METGAAQRDAGDARRAPSPAALSRASRARDRPRERWPRRRRESARRPRRPAAALCRSMPPSISIGAAALPARSSSARTSRTLDSLRGMNVWPPKPGLTDMTSTKSTSPAICFEGADRRRRIEDDARLDAERLDRVHRAVQVRQHFDVHRHHRRAGVRERLDVAVRVLDHQVHVERHPRDALERPHDRRADRDVRHEMAVHHVDVNEIGAAALDRRDRVAERREVGGEDRRRDLHAHRLTSIEIGSPGAI